MTTNETRSARLRQDIAEERGAVLALLEENRLRRASAATEVKTAKEQLKELLVRGYGVGLQVTDMANNAGVSRETAHRVLKESGDMSWKDKQAWAAKVMAQIHRGTLERNMFRMAVNSLLLKALGGDPGDVPQSVQGVLTYATGVMKRQNPGFEPEFDADVLGLAWPTGPALG